MKSFLHNQRDTQSSRMQKSPHAKNQRSGGDRAVSLNMRAFWYFQNRVLAASLSTE